MESLDLKGMRKAKSKFASTTKEAETDFNAQKFVSGLASAGEIRTLQNFESYSQPLNFILERASTEASCVKKKVMQPSRCKKGKKRIICEVDYDCILHPRKQLYVPLIGFKKDLGMQLFTVKDIKAVSLSIENVKLK